MSANRVWIMLMAAAALCLMTVSASAQSNPLKRKPKDPVAREHLEQGNRYYRVLEYDKAIEEYKAGASVEGHEIFYYNLGQAFRQTGQYEEAIRMYEQWLARAKNVGDLRQVVEGHIEQMKAELAKKASTQPPTGPGGDNDAETRPEAPRPAAKVPSPTEAARSSLQRQENDDNEGVQSPLRGEPWYADGLGWGLTGGGLITLGAGVGLLISASGIDDDAAREDREAIRNELRDKAATRRTLGYAIGGIGSALAIAGVTKLAITAGPERSSPSGQLSLAVQFTNAGFSVSGTF